MGFNKRRMDSERAAAAAKEAEARRGARAADFGGCCASSCRLERSTGKAHADAVLAEHRRRNHCPLLVSVGALPRVPHYAVGGPPNARSPPRCSGNESHPRSVVPILPPECALCRIVEAVDVERGR